MKELVKTKAIANDKTFHFEMQNQKIKSNK